MNESQKVRQIIVELLDTQQGGSRPKNWLENEVKLAGYNPLFVDGELGTLEALGMIKSERDGFGLVRWSITDHGVNSLRA